MRVLRAILRDIKGFLIVVSSVVIAVLLLILKRRESTLSDVKAELIKARVDKELNGAKEKAGESINEYYRAREQYKKLLEANKPSQPKPPSES